MLETAIRAAREAGRLLLAGSRREIQVDRIGRRDVKLAMDRKAEEAILRILRKKFPGHAVLSEECGRVGPKSEYRWVIDPLDGTVNYSRRIPLWGTSIGLMRGGEEILGVIFDPVRDELFCAEKGSGAFLNGKRIRVNERDDLKSAIIAYGFSAREDYLKRGLAIADRLARKASKVRAVGSAALHLAWVACGRMDGFFEVGLHPWDVAAGVAIIREAGGEVSSRPLPGGILNFVCSNGRIHSALLKQVGWQDVNAGTDP